MCPFCSLFYYSLFATFGIYHVLVHFISFNFFVLSFNVIFCGYPRNYKMHSKLVVVYLKLILLSHPDHCYIFTIVILHLPLSCFFGVFFWLLLSYISLHICYTFQKALLLLLLLTINIFLKLTYILTFSNSVHSFMNFHATVWGNFPSLQKASYFLECESAGHRFFSVCVCLAVCLNCPSFSKGDFSE